MGAGDPEHVAEGDQDDARFGPQGQEGVQVGLIGDAHRAAGAGNERNPWGQKGFEAEAGGGHGVGAADLHDGGGGFRKGGQDPQAPGQVFYQCLVPELVNKLHRPGSGGR